MMGLRGSVDMASRMELIVSRLVVGTVLSAEQAGSEMVEKIRVLETAIKDVLKLMAEHRGYDDTFLKLENRYKSLVEEKEELYNELKQVQEIAYGRYMAIMGFGFSIVSLGLSLLPLFLTNVPSSLKPALFGFSVGVGVGGILTSIGGLSSGNNAMRFLSGVGIASSLVGLGVDFHELREN